jgi:hypothetical protein
MRQLQPTAALAALLGTDIALLLLAAALTPEQNPALPIELSVLLAGLTAWVLVRRSRAAALGCTVFTTLMLLLTVHILIGDIGEKGPRELVPDILLLVSFAASVIAAAASTRVRTRLAA